MYGASVRSCAPFHPTAEATPQRTSSNEPSGAMQQRSRSPAKAGCLRHDAAPGIRTAIQVPHVYTIIENARDFAALLPRLDHPALAFLVSPTHALARGSTIEQFQELCGSRLAILNAWNVKRSYVAAADDRRWGT